MLLVEATASYYKSKSKDKFKKALTYRTILHNVSEKQGN